MPATEPLSEYRIGKHIGDSLARDGVAIKYVATDGDALASRGIQDAMPLHENMTSNLSDVA